MKKKRLLTRVVLPVCLAFAAFAGAPAAQAQPFTFLQPGFTQTVFGHATSLLFGGVAFAPDGDVYVDNCQFSGGSLARFDLQTTMVEHGTTDHPQEAGSPFASNTGCGLTNHSDGNLYSNIDDGTHGIAKLNVNTGAPISAFGPRGNSLGITVDPQTNHLVYVGQDCRASATCTIVSIDPATTTSSNFAVLSSTDAALVDGIAFDPTGNFLFLSNRLPSTRLTILDRTGSIVQHVAMTSEPDGIAFHASTPKFVVTDNTDSTMTRFDFPGDDFTKPPSQTVFASGGFRGDLSQVGSDGCLYISQDGTRFNDATTSTDESVVQICGGFAPPPTNQPPDCSKAAASAPTLWPPNHKFVDESILGVTDTDGDSVTITITGIRQDEPVLQHGTGSGNFCPDGTGVGTATADVRAERGGNPNIPGDGRVYHIAFSADDGKGGTCTGTVAVCVPHDQGHGGGCIDEGPLFDSTVCP
jgi:hypothetical protein